MRTSIRLLCALVGLLAGGCMFQNLSPQNRLNEHVFVLNDAARWGRIDVAIANVDADYRQRYAVRHEHWGEAIQIAEASIVSMQLDEDKEAATSQVKVSWYQTDTLTLHQSTIMQRWKADGQSFLLVDEKISGDVALFADDSHLPVKPPVPAEGEGEGKGESDEVSAG